jgi:hypothetical protein
MDPATYVDMFGPAGDYRDWERKPYLINLRDGYDPIPRAETLPEWRARAEEQVRRYGFVAVADLTGKEGF